MDTFSMQKVTEIYNKAIAEMIQKVQADIEIAARNRRPAAFLKGIDKDLSHYLEVHFQNLGFTVTVLHSRADDSLIICGWLYEGNKKEI
jgi:hypothetical protein